MGKENHPSTGAKPPIDSTPWVAEEADVIDVSPYLGKDPDSAPENPDGSIAEVIPIKPPIIDAKDIPR